MTTSVLIVEERFVRVVFPEGISPAQTIAIDGE